MNNPLHEMNRRRFLTQSTLGLGGAAIASLLDPLKSFGQLAVGVLPTRHFAPKAKRVIYLFQSGGPSQIELFDYKPRLSEMVGQDIPASVRGDQRLSGMVFEPGRVSFGGIDL